jgi:hypothetical protein
MLKKLLPILLIVTSCYKPTGPYTQIPEDVDTQYMSKDEYIDGGLITYGGSEPNNILVGTTWVITKVVSGLSTNSPNDTLRFISDNRYTLNQNAQRLYTYSQITGSTNKSITLDSFYPFGGSNYSSQISPYAVQDGELNNIEFTDLQNNTKIIKAWLKKI